MFTNRNNKITIVIRNLILNFFDNIKQKKLVLANHTQIDFIVYSNINYNIYK